MNLWYVFFLGNLKKVLNGRMKNDIKPEHLSSPKAASVNV